MFVRTGTETAHLEVINNCDEKRTPYKVIGGGGNNIYYLTEEQVQSIMIIQKNTMSEMVFEDGNFIISSGALLFESVLFAFDKGYDISQLAGIPGAVGGAIYGNAGAYGLKIKDILHSCTIYDRTSIHSVSARSGYKARLSHFIFERRFMLWYPSYRNFQRPRYPRAIAVAGNVRWQKSSKFCNCAMRSCHRTRHRGQSSAAIDEP